MTWNELYPTPHLRYGDPIGYPDGKRCLIGPVFSSLQLGANIVPSFTLYS